MQICFVEAFVVNENYAAAFSIGLNEIVKVN